MGSMNMIYQSKQGSTYKTYLCCYHFVFNILYYDCTCIHAFPFCFRWKIYKFNDKTYCESVQKNFHPYEHMWYYLDLFDFAVLDTLMYHFDTKHYIINDESSAQGLTVRLDHGRT